VTFLGEKLLGRGIPIVVPTGGHAIFWTPKASFRTSPGSDIPLIRPSRADLYGESGVADGARQVSAGRNRKLATTCTRNSNGPPDLSRRVFTQGMSTSLARPSSTVRKARGFSTGLKLVYEPKYCASSGAFRRLLNRHSGNRASRRHSTGGAPGRRLAAWSLDAGPGFS
jgi:tyrosine phenol-lyase